VADDVLRGGRGIDEAVGANSKNHWFGEIINQWDSPVVDAACKYVTDYPGAWTDTIPSGSLAADQVAEWSSEVWAWTNDANGRGKRMRCAVGPCRRGAVLVIRGQG
jgi:hypothetical protein